MSTCGFILLEEDARQISEVLKGFLKETDAKCCLIIDRGGQLIASEGDLESLDTMSLSALAAGAFASTREIAKLVGETEFTVLFHKGRKEHICVSHVDGDTLMMAIFDDNTTIGIVSLYSKEAEAKVSRIMSESKKRQKEGGVKIQALDLSGSGDVFSQGKS